jgi:hypothetical protein
VKNGVVVLAGDTRPPEGAPVSVRLLKGRARVGRRNGAEAPRERLANVVGIIKDLPPDFSANLDHYLYGTPKRK